MCVLVAHRILATAVSEDSVSYQNQSCKGTDALSCGARRLQATDRLKIFEWATDIRSLKHDNREAHMHYQV
jgi:hypothetical protein